MLGLPGHQYLCGINWLSFLNKDVLVCVLFYNSYCRNKQSAKDILKRKGVSFDDVFSALCTRTVEFSLNVFTEFSDKNNIIFKKIVVLKPTITCVRDSDSTTGPQGHS